ncbi:MAG TPA: sialidase family protein [Kribbella sp.]|uniref:sialidase family protein n=1 Tax=Kribbella sp. TaxID=1871183 RepID=UPI002D777DDC|nr:sialidase family protein [Kribbella sp.]HET6295868.1 sialidase family protein [Kribbella sp.]
MALSRRTFIGGAASVAALGVTGAGVVFPQRALALDPDGMESKMLFGDAQAGAAAIPKESGSGNYHSCRIPSIFAIPGSSVVIAVVEGRPNDVADASGNINLLMRRSTDSGLTWSAATTLAGAGLQGWTNPTLVHDRTTGRLTCFMLRRQLGELYVIDPDVYIATSENNGATWTNPVARPDLNRAAGGNDFIGPGNGIQRADGTLVVPARGRLIIKAPGGDWASHGLPQGLSDGPYGEGTVTERSDGRLILNYRALDREIKNGGTYPHTRRIAIGNPGSWQMFGQEYWRAQIIDPGAHAAQISHSINGVPHLIHLNSATREIDNRYVMTLRASADDGETWTSYQQPLSEDPLASEGDLAGNLREGGYSALTSTGSGLILALVEARRVQYNNPSLHDLNHNSPCAVVLRRFDPSWIVP